MPAPGAWWDDDPELARLRFDSALRVEAPPGPSCLRVLTFVARRLTIELEVRPGAVRGRLVPLQAATVSIRHDDGRSWSAPADDAGRFTITGAATGEVRLRIDAGTGLVVITDAVTL